MQYIVHSVFCGERRLQSSLFIIISFLKILPYMGSCAEKEEMYQDINSYNFEVIAGITDNFM